MYIFTWVKIRKSKLERYIGTLPPSCVYCCSLILPDVLGAKAKKRIRSGCWSSGDPDQIRFKIVVVPKRNHSCPYATHSRTHPFSLLGPYSFKVRKRWMAFNQKRDSTFKLSTLHHSCLTIILFIVSENRLLVVLRFDEV